MPSEHPAWDLAACLAWVGFIFLCMYYGPVVAPWVKGAGRLPSVAALSAAGLGFAAWVVWRLARLTPVERAGRGIGAILCLVGLAVLAWWQPILIERSHLVLYGGLAVLAWRVAGRWWRGGPRFAWAVGFSALVSLADEVAQHFHPPRMFDLRDVFTNTASAVLALAAVALLLGRKNAAGPWGPAA